MLNLLQLLVFTPTLPLALKQTKCDLCKTNKTTPVDLQLDYKYLVQL